MAGGGWEFEHERHGTELCTHKAWSRSLYPRCLECAYGWGLHPEPGDMPRSRGWVNGDSTESDEISGFLHPFVDDRQPVFNFPCSLRPFLAVLLM